MKIIKNRYLPVLILLLICLSFYWPVFFQKKVVFPGDMLVGAYYPWLEYKWGYQTGVPIKNPYITDIFSQIYPWKKIIAEIYKNGQMPLWNPYSLSGYPLLANYQSGALNPFNLIFLINSPPLALNLYLISGSLLLAFSMYIFCLELFSSRVAGVMAAIVTGFTGFSILWMPYANANFSQAAIIMSLYALEKFFKTKKYHYLYLLVPSLVLLVFSGHLQLLIYGAIIIGAYLFFKSYQQHQFRITWLFPFIFAIIISSPQWVSTIDLYHNSIREFDNFIEQFNYGLSPLSKLVTLISPDFFGNPTTNNYWGNFNYHETCIYFSLIGLISLVFFINKRSKNKTINFFILTTVISIFSTINLPITQTLYKIKLPLLFSSVPGRISGILIISSGVLTAALISEIEKQKIKSTTFLKSSVWLIPLVIILTIFCALTAKFYSPLTTQAYTAFRNLFYPFLLLTALIFLLYLSTKNYKFLYLALIFIIFDSFRFAYKSTPFVKSEFLFPTTPSLEKISSDPEIFRIVSEKGEILPPNTWIGYNQLSPGGYDPLTPLSYARQFNHYLNDNPGDGVSRYQELYSFNAPRLGEYSVKYLFAIKRKPDGSLRGNQINIKYKPQDWENYYETAETVILKNKYYQAISNYPIISWQPGKVIFNLKSQTPPSTLIYRENYYSGWQAYSDGRNIPIEKDNQGLIKINLKPEYNKLTLIYFPNYLKYLFYISFSFFILWILLILFLIKNESRP